MILLLLLICCCCCYSYYYCYWSVTKLLLLRYCFWYCSVLVSVPSLVLCCSCLSQSLCLIPWSLGQGLISNSFNLFYSFRFLGLLSHYSTILAGNVSYSTHLNNFLAPAVGVNSLWVLCYRASAQGWAASTFHSRCDGKRDTVAIIKRGEYVFGGYTDIPWGMINLLICMIKYTDLGKPNSGGPDLKGKQNFSLDQKLKLVNFEHVIVQCVVSFHYIFKWNFNKVYPTSVSKIVEMMYVI